MQLRVAQLWSLGPGLGDLLANSTDIAQEMRFISRKAGAGKRQFHLAANWGMLAGDLQKEVTNVLHNAIDRATMYGTYNVLCLEIVCRNLRVAAFEILPVCDLPARLLCGC
ncbi:MAG TPA: hypothetical protein VIT00_06630 [Terrimicrobiaceae bacterium]